MCASVTISMVKGDGGRAIEEEMKVGKEGHRHKKFNSLIPAAQQFKLPQKTER